MRRFDMRRLAIESVLCKTKGRNGEGDRKLVIDECLGTDG